MTQSLASEILQKSIEGVRITPEEGVILFRFADFLELGAAADQIRQRLHQKDEVTFVVDRNINYTNVCTARCKFCAFAYTPDDEVNTYTLSYDVIREKIQELVECGGTQILLQGGHNPKLDIHYYVNLFQMIKADFPNIVLHALSPSEIEHISKTSDMRIAETISLLNQAGWESFPGGGAEILVDRVRRIISPYKTSSQNWLDIMEVAHNTGIHGSATMMFGHVESYAERIQHMDKIRALQDKTNGFRAFISWTFQRNNTSLAVHPKLVEGEGEADSIDYLRTQAISRLYLDNVPNIQASWVTQGLQVGQIALHFGANDFGGTMLEENVVSAAGTKHSKSNKDELAYQIRMAGYTPVQRNTFYQKLSMK